MGIHIGRLIVDPSVIQKLNSKHQVTVPELREALEWPAKALVAREQHPEYGLRWVALGRTASDRQVIAVLVPHRSGKGRGPIRG